MSRTFDEMRNMGSAIANMIPMASIVQLESACLAVLGELSMDGWMLA